MIGSQTDQTNPAELDAPDDRGRFLGSHRAHGACVREFNRLADDVARLVTALPRAADAEAPELRLTPGRYVVQVGPVALTLSWLRSTLDSVADGRLLAVAWQGTVSRGANRTPERITPRNARTAVAMWEEVLQAEATSETDWRWRPEGNTSVSYGCTELAERCVAPLRDALLSHQQSRTA